MASICMKWPNVNEKMLKIGKNDGNRDDKHKRK